MARNHDPRDRLMVLRDQVIWDTSSWRLLICPINGLKARGAADRIDGLQREFDALGKRIERLEGEIKELEARPFGK